MGRKQKKGGGGGAAKKRAAAAAALNEEEIREELLALEAIFGEDLAVHDGAGLGFSLHVVPHPGEAAANHVSLTLVVRCGGRSSCWCSPGDCLLRQLLHCCQPVDALAVLVSAKQPPCSQHVFLPTCCAAALQ